MVAAAATLAPAIAIRIDTIRREHPGVLVLQPTILEDGKDRLYPHAFRTPAEREAFTEGYVSQAVPGLPHLFVSRELLAAGRGGGR